MKKKQIIIAAIVGLIGFAGSFVLTRLVKGPCSGPQQAKASTEQAAKTGIESSEGIGHAVIEGPETGKTATSNQNLARSMAEKQLQNLITDIREKMDEYNSREKELSSNQTRVQTTRQLLAEDIRELETLQGNLTQALAALKEQQASLEKTVILVNSTEKTNLQRIAGTYDKMDTANAGKIIASMAAGNQFDDAVKIIYYMSERNSAKLLGEIGNTQPELAGRLSLQLKRIRENN